jgi:hypothetical protein
MKHIWLHKKGKTELELETLGKSKPRIGSHELLSNEIGSHIKSSGSKNFNDDFRVYNNNLLQLKKLRLKADYEDTVFDSAGSKAALALSNLILPVLTKYSK